MTDQSSHAPAQLGFEQLGIGDVLQRHKLVVPINQREYAWTERQVKQLLADFQRAMVENDVTYFLGTIVTIPKAHNVLEVIDGQQRLATTALLVRAIERALTAAGENMMAQSLQPFLMDWADDRRSQVPKITLNKVDNELFQAIMRNEKRPKPTMPSHFRLEDASNLTDAHVQNVLKAWTQVKDHGDALRKWISFIHHYAIVILLKVPNPSNAYKMFETLNDRGLKTSQSDLIKNYLFGQAAGRIAECQMHWDSMRSTLATIEADDELTMLFIRQAMIVLEGHMTEAEIFDTIQAKYRGADKAVEISSVLDSLSNEYTAIFNVEHKKWNPYPPKTGRALRTLILFDIKPYRPLLLAISKKFSPKEAGNTYEMLVNWAVRLLIAATVRSGSVEQPLAEAAHEVYKEKLNTQEDIRKKLLKIIPTDIQFKESFATISVSQAKFARYYLRTLERTARGTPDDFNEANSSQDVVNLEHILPMKPDANWTISADIVSAFAKRLGNQTLMRAKDNSDLKSTGFKEKKNVYKDTPYVLTQELATVSTWDEKMIAKRQLQLADYAVKAWPI